MNHLTLHDLLAAKEGENLEFKEKKHRFDFEELVKYACAIANCEGSSISAMICNIIRSGFSSGMCRPSTNEPPAKPS